MKIVKYSLSIVLCNLYRLLRFIPNNDPVMGVMLPYSKQGKWWEAGLFAFLTMASFDLITGKVGIWTLATSATYAALGVGFFFAYRKMKIKKMSIWKYLASGVVGVLVFDFITGPIMSSWMFAMPFEAALLGQIPFTLLHLASVSVFVVVLTPLLDRHVISNGALEDASIKRLFLAQAARH